MTSRPNPQVIKRLTVRVYEELAPCQHIVEILRAIDREFPGLSYRDFYLAVALAEHFEREVKGRACHTAPSREPPACNDEYADMIDDHAMRGAHDDETD